MYYETEGVVFSVHDDVFKPRFFLYFSFIFSKIQKKLPFDGGALSQLDRDMLDMCGQSPARSGK